MIVLEAQAVGKFYVPGAWVFRGLTLRLEGGAALAVVGPNGAGKTTLLKLLAGLAEPSNGVVRLRLGEQSYKPSECLWWAVGIVAPFVGLYEEFTPWELMHVGLAMRGRRWEERVAERVIGELGLAAVLHRRIAELSSGMQQRVRIALALLHQPIVLAFDEVTATLDGAGIAAVGRLVQWHCQSGGILVVATNAEHELQWCRRAVELPRLTEREL